MESGESGGGFKHIIMKPDFGITKLKGVYSSHRSPYGIIKSHWLRKDGKITWNVDIPDGCTAELHLPDTILNVASGHHSISFAATLSHPGRKFMTMQDASSMTVTNSSFDCDDMTGSLTGCSGMMF